MHLPHIEKIEPPVADVTGVILAGGRSSRMGEDKAVLEVHGQRLFDRVLSGLQTFFTRVLIAGNRPDLARADVPFFADRYPGSAMGGLFTGLTAAATPWIFVAPCDMPFVDPQLVRALLKRREGHDAVVPLTPRGYEPLFALYHKNCLRPMQDLLEGGQRRILDLYPRIRLECLEPSALPPGWEKALTNVNTPEDFRRLTEEKP